MDSKTTFFKIIFEHYNHISNGELNSELLVEMSNRINDYYYEQYSRFTIQYPKSIKRYSSFQLKDLEHPTTYEIIIKFFKEKSIENYSEYSKLILNMNEIELNTFEKSREDFYNMF